MEVKYTPSDIPSLEQQTPAFRLFNYHYLAYMQMSDHLHDADVNVFGLALSNNEAFNLELSRSMDPRYMTPAEMAYVVAGEGKKLILADPKDAVKIYKDIDAHLCRWRDVVKYSGITDIPLEGLYEFDQLAALMIYIARGHGLVTELDRRAKYASRRSIRNRGPMTPMASLRHSGAVFMELLRDAKDAGVDVWRFRHKLNEKTDKTGSI